MEETEEAWYGRVDWCLGNLNDRVNFLEQQEPPPPPPQPPQNSEFLPQQFANFSRTLEKATSDWKKEWQAEKDLFHQHMALMLVEAENKQAAWMKEEADHNQRVYVELSTHLEGIVAKQTADLRAEFMMQIQKSTEIATGADKQWAEATERKTGQMMQDAEATQNLRLAQERSVIAKCEEKLVEMDRMLKGMQVQVTTQAQVSGGDETVKKLARMQEIMHDRQTSMQNKAQKDQSEMAAFLQCNNQKDACMGANVRCKIPTSGSRKCQIEKNFGIIWQ